MQQKNIRMSYARRKSLVNYLSLLAIVLTAMVFEGCQKDILDQEKYQPPAWESGKLFTQIKEFDDLTTFQLFLTKSGYDSIINRTGSYTVFAPTNEAFEQFFTTHPEYRSLLESNQTSDKINALVEYHMFYNAWNIDQFQKLDIGGWIDPKDEFSAPRAYKRKSLYRPDNKFYPVRRRDNLYQIVDSSQSSLFKKAFTQSTKFAPIFFQQFLNIYNLSPFDYEYYFKRPFNQDKLYFAEAEFDEAIPAENGFIYKIDRVVLPLKSGIEILENGTNNHSYKDFIYLIQEFSEFRTNLTETLKQPGVAEGKQVDTLFNLSYPELVFNIHNELTGNITDEKLTYREHHGLLAPTNEAIKAFLDEYLSGWGSLQDLPRGTKNIIVNTHMSANAIYPGDFSKGFENGAGDIVILEQENVIQQTFGSNCTFLGLNKVILPRALVSVSRPMYITRSFEKMMYAAELTKVISALKKPNVNYSFFLPSDNGTGDVGDSSINRVVTNPALNRYHFEGFDMSARRNVRYSTNDLRKKIMNQIGTDVPLGLANKEFIRNLGGNYIIVNNSNGTVRGTAPTVFGLNGDSTIHLVPKILAEGSTDNGVVYEVDTWFNYLRGSSYYGFFLSQSPKFLSLLTKAKLFDPLYSNFPFLIEGQFYTVFVPTDEALNAYGADALSVEELKEFLLYHFVKEELIFTDGRGADGKYQTLRTDESSTTYSTNFSTLNIRNRPDKIEILDKYGNVYLEINEDEVKTNRMVTYDSNKDSDSEWDYITTGVLHRIDKVMIKDSLQVN